MPLSSSHTESQKKSSEPEPITPVDIPSQQTDKDPDLIVEMDEDELAEQARLEEHKNMMERLKAERSNEKRNVIDDSEDEEPFNCSGDLFTGNENDTNAEENFHFSQHSSIALRKEAEFPQSPMSPDVGITLDQIKQANNRHGLKWLAPPG